MKPLILTFLFLASTLLSFSSKTAWYTDKSEWNSLMKATYKQQYKKLKRIVAKGKVDVNYKTSRWGLSALEIAIRNDDSIAFDILIESSKLRPDSTGKLISLSCSGKSAYMLKKLYQNKFPILKTNSNNFSLLMTACSSGSSKIVKYLIDLGFDVNEKNKVDGMTPLMYACYNGQKNTVRLLLSSGAMKNSKDKNGKKAIDHLKSIHPRKEVSRETIDEIKQMLL